MPRRHPLSDTASSWRRGGESDVHGALPRTRYRAANVREYLPGYIDRYFYPDIIRKHIDLGSLMDRKALSHAYKASRRPMGVYCVRNLQTGETLIGRSTDVQAILNRERTALRMGGHPNRPLQQDWNARGADAFVFEVLDTLAWPEDTPDFDPTNDLLLLEAMWRERMQPNGKGGYTTTKTSGRT